MLTKLIGVLHLQDFFLNKLEKGALCALDILRGTIFFMLSLYDVSASFP